MLWDIDHMPPKKWRLDQKRLDQKRQICCSRNKYVILCLKFMCVALIFQGIYVYLHIYSIYWISHPLTNNSTWRASKRDSLLKIYNDIRIYIYIIVILQCWRFVCIHLEPTGYPIHLELAGIFHPNNLAFFHEAVVFESTSPGFPERRFAFNGNNRPKRVGTMGDFSDGNMGWGLKPLENGKLGANEPRVWLFFFL